MSVPLYAHAIRYHPTTIQIRLQPKTHKYRTHWHWVIAQPDRYSVTTPPTALLVSTLDRYRNASPPIVCGAEPLACSSVRPYLVWSTNPSTPHEATPSPLPSRGHRSVGLSIYLWTPTHMARDDWCTFIGQRSRHRLHCHTSAVDWFWSWELGPENFLISFCPFSRKYLKPASRHCFVLAPGSSLFLALPFLLLKFLPIFPK